MAINSFTFNGVNSLTQGLYVSGGQTFNSAEKDFSKVSVPGRNGDLLIDNKRFKNSNVKYDAIIIENYEVFTENVRAWLLSANGYCRLEDTYHPDEFRFGVFSGSLEFDTIMLEAGETTITFDCKPERWLKSGETEIITTSSTNTTLVNPTMFESKPIIRVYGTGHVHVGSGSFTVNTAGNSYIDIDCDLMDCYEGPINRNGNVTITAWPKLLPGNNAVTLPGSVSQIKTTPRWWTV